MADISYIATIADLKALSDTSSAALATVYVEGYYADADGGEGVFHWSSTSSASGNGGTIIELDSAPASGRWIRATNGAPYSVKWFGAKGDNSTDDAAAIQSALNSGAGVVVCPAGGVYLIGTTLVPAAGQEVIIEGGATLKLADGADQPVIEIENARAVVGGFGTIDGNAANQTSGFGGNAHAIRIAANVDGWTIRDVRITNTQSQGIRFSPSGTAFRNWRIANVRLDAILDHAIHASATVGGQIEGCRIETTTRAGIVIVGGEGTIVSGNYAYDCGSATSGQAAYYLEGKAAFGVVFDGNTAVDCGQHAFRNESWHAVEGAVWSNNTVINPGLSGWILAGAVGVKLIGNTVRDAGTNGYNLIGVARSSVADNVAIASARSGIAVQGCTDTVLSDNTVLRAGQDGTQADADRSGIQIKSYTRDGGVVTDEGRSVSVRGGVVADDQDVRTMMYGVHIDGADEGLSVSGVKVVGAYVDGVLGVDCQEVRCADNDVSLCGQHGIHFQGPVRIAIDGNWCYDNGLRTTGDGIHVAAGTWSTQRLSIGGNRCFTDQSDTHSVSAVDDADNLLTIAGHRLQPGMVVQISSTGSLPAPLAANTDYYVLVAGRDAVKLASSFGGSDIDLTSQGSGTITLTEQTTMRRAITVAVAPVQAYPFTANFAVGTKNASAPFSLAGEWIGGWDCTPKSPYQTGTQTVTSGGRKFVVDTTRTTAQGVMLVPYFVSAPSAFVHVVPTMAWSTNTATMWAGVQELSGLGDVEVGVDVYLTA